MVLARVVDGVPRDLDHQVAAAHNGLAAQARVGLQAPGAVQQVFFGFFDLVQAAAPLAHDHVAGGAGAAHVAGVLDGDAVFEQGLADAAAGAGLDAGALGAELVVGQDADLGHGAMGMGGRGSALKAADVLSGQGLLDALVHALGGKGLGALGQRVGGGL